jgi:GNAT superfamily N-acetyltransferase
MSSITNVTFKKCTWSDCDLLLAIAIQSYRESYLYLWEDSGEAYMAAVYGKETFFKDFLNPGVTFYLIYVGKEPAGYMKLKESPWLTYPDHYGLELEKLYILAAHIRKGLGKMSLAFVETLLTKHSPYLLWLDVMEGSEAMRFYLDNGFIQVRQRILPYTTMKKEYRSLLTMIKTAT